MTMYDFLAGKNLNSSLLIGYYGGGNYGDELLLEILQNLLVRQGTKQVAIAYQRPSSFNVLHEDFGYEPFDMRGKVQLLKRTLTSRNIIVGGGGLWGVDMNFNTFLMSAYLWLSRWLLGRKIYLMGVGYYNSTSHMGHIAAWLAGKAANAIFARDSETYQNFSRVNSRVTHLDTDLAWYAPQIDLTRYEAAAEQLGKQLNLDTKTLILAIRRPQAPHQQVDFSRLTTLIESCIADNPGIPIIVAQLELAVLDPQGTARLKSWAAAYKNIRLLDKPMNPLVLYVLFQRHRDNIAVIAPQFHIILTAHLNNVPFLPIVYDNKVRLLLEHIGVPAMRQLPLANVELADMQRFVDTQIQTT